MSKKVLIAVFNPSTLERIGLITKYTSILFTKKSKDVGSFELWCDLDDNNVKMVEDGNLIYVNSDKVGIVQYVEEQVGDGGIKSLNVKGKTIKYYMSYRIIMGTYEAYSKYVSDVMNDIVVKNFINPEDTCRVFEHMSISDRSQVGAGPQITVQKTGGEVMEELDALASSYSFCYDVSLNVSESKFEFEVYRGTDRTVNQSDVTPVVISTDLKDILSSKYVRNSQDVKNVVLVAGAGEGSLRKTLLVGDTESVGVSRKEMYVDARDLSITSEDESGNTIVLPDEEYNMLLQDRGESKMNEQKVVESFDAEVRTAGRTNCVCGIDYFLGDTITAIDKRLGVMVDAEVTEIEEVYSGADGHSLKVTFGFGQPTVVDKLKAVDREAKKTMSMGGITKSMQDIDDKVSSSVESLSVLSDTVDKNASDANTKFVDIKSSIQTLIQANDSLAYIALANALGWKRSVVAMSTYSDLGTVYVAFVPLSDLAEGSTYLVKLNNGSIHKVIARTSGYGVYKGIVLVGNDVATATASGVSTGDVTVGKKAWVTDSDSGYTSSEVGAPLAMSSSDSVVAWYCRIGDESTVKDVISNSSGITSVGQYALDATEKNSSLVGTLAYQLNSLSTKIDGLIDSLVWKTTIIDSTYGVIISKRAGELRVIVRKWPWSVSQAIEQRIFALADYDIRMGDGFQKAMDTNGGVRCIMYTTNGYLCIKPSSGGVVQGYWAYIDEIVPIRV